MSADIGKILLQVVFEMLNMLYYGSQFESCFFVCGDVIIFYTKKHGNMEYIAK